MPHIKTNGIQMHYEERGSGDPLILIMGITAPGALWEVHAEHWEQNYRCIMVDNRGIGKTDKPEGDYSSSMMADDYAGLMDALGIESAKVVGVSMGSIIAQQLCLRHSEKVKSAVLMCPWARCDEYAKSIFNHIEATFAHLTPVQFMEWIQLLIFAKPFWDNPDGYAGLLEGRTGFGIAPEPQPLVGLVGQSAACKSHNMISELGNISQKCLVIGGKDDIFTPLWMAEEVAGGIPECDTYFYDDAGHAFHFEYTEDFNQRVLDWLNAN